jgi:hypothetical protein
MWINTMKREIPRNLNTMTRKILQKGKCHEKINAMKGKTMVVEM